MLVDTIAKDKLLGAAWGCITTITPRGYNAGLLSDLSSPFGEPKA